MTCGVVCRGGLDPALLWLWCRPVGVAPIQPLAWELPYATSMALKRKKKKRFHTIQYQKKLNNLIKPWTEALNRLFF